MEKMIINLSPNGGLSIDEAVAVMMGMLPLNVLSGDKAKCIEGELTAQFVEINMEKGEYHIGANPLPLARPCAIFGNGSTVIGQNAVAFIAMSSFVTVKDLHFDHNAVAFMINGHDGVKVDNVTVSDCKFTNCSTMAMGIGNDKSDGVISNVKIENCEFVGSEAGFDDSMGGTMMIALGAALIKGSDTVNNCLLDGLEIKNCKFHGKYRMAVQFLCGMPQEMLGATLKEEVSENNEVRNVKITDNYFENSFDATINVIAGCMGQKNASCHDLLIARNKIVQGLWAIYLTGCEPVYGACGTGRTYNVEIADNEIYPIGDVGEITYGVAIQAGRIDYFDGTRAFDSSVENVHIHGNKFAKLNKGVFVTGADILFDAPNNIVENCRVSGLKVENNTFTDCEDMIDIYGANHEGRRIDWQIGIPPHEKIWGELIDDEVVASKTTGNGVSNVEVKNNVVDGYRYKYRVAGVWGIGQGEGKNNVVENVLFEDNNYSRGEGRISNKPVSSDDRFRDGGGNEVKNFIFKK